MYLTSILVAIIELIGPVVVLYIFACIIIDIIVRAFRGGY